MSIKLFSCEGGNLVLPDSSLVLVSRMDGGNLIVNPPVTVWERSELSRDQLMMWSFLVASAGRAMLDSLPQLEGGCINYWEAGNWALNKDSEPKGFKTAREHRKVHLHLLGRSPASTDPSWKWGESPVFPAFKEKDTWAATHERLNPQECLRIVKQTELLLKSRYGLKANQVAEWSPCAHCGYPVSGPNKSCSE
jgi:hypothetical protein